MCGLAGFIDFNKRSDRSSLISMTEKLIHRGPDDHGAEFFECEYANIGLGFRRLSILDLTPAGHQPMRSPDSELWIMLNGEIYNFQEIRLELENKGCRFVSNSDTEVALKAYEVFGQEMVSKFIGMFSIVIFDRKRNKVILYRDRAGVKPLFWYLRNGLFLFASELKAFHAHPGFNKEIEEQSLAHFFSNGTIPAPYSIFKNTWKVEPGCYMVVDLKTREIERKSYWNVFNIYDQQKSSLTYSEAKESLKIKLADACRLRMVSDVPVGVFLSGGYDSTAVVALLQNEGFDLNTYTIGFDVPRFDESKHASAVAGHLGVKNENVVCDLKEAVSIIPELPDIYDEPFGDPSAIPTVLVSRIARKYVTVALSADAGDELFAGYPRHIKAYKYLSYWSALPGSLKQTIGTLLQLGINKDKPLSKSDLQAKAKKFFKSRTLGGAFEAINQTYTIDEINRLLNRKIEEPLSVYTQLADYRHNVDLLNQLLAIEYGTYLIDDIMQKVDRASMSCSLEGREPLLDHRLVEFVASLPSEYKLSNGVGKKILKDIVHDFVPEEIMNRPKMGFGVPIDNWLRNELRELFDEVMNADSADQTGILNKQKVSEIKEGYLNGNYTDIYRIWYIFVFLQWYKRWM